MSHTPGPWHVEKGDSVVFIRGGDGTRIAATDSKTYYQRHDETDIANARLIAAAPDLLEIVTQLRAALVEDKSLVASEAYESDDVAWFVARIDAALAKVEAKP